MSDKEHSSWSLEYAGRVFRNFGVIHGADDHTVFEAEDIGGSGGSDRVIVKAFSSLPRDDDEFGWEDDDDPYKMELRALQAVPKGPLIVPLLYHFTATDAAGGPCRFLVFPFIESRPAAEVLTTAAAVREALHQLLRALACIHAVGFMHRDVKPGNILLVPDFSFSSSSSSSSSDTSTPTAELPASPASAAAAAAAPAAAGQEREEKQNATRDFRLVLIDFGLCVESSRLLEGAGTPGYRAPEVYMDFYNRIGPPSDVWSAGCVFYQWLLGRRLVPTPEEKEKSITFYDEHRAHFAPEVKGEHGVLLPSPIPADRTHLITPEAVNLCQRMLTYEPEKRIAINEALRHPYFTSCLTCVPCEGAGEGDGGGGAGGEGDR